LLPNKFVLYDPEKLDAPRTREIFETDKKILVQEVRNISLKRRIIATLDTKRIYALQSTNVITLKPEGDHLPSIRIEALLGVINSSVINFFFSQNYSGNNHIASYQLASIPIPFIDDNVQSKLSDLVNNILREKSADQTDTTDLEAEIDLLVYRLYGLSWAEVKLVDPDFGMREAAYEAVEI